MRLSKVAKELNITIQRIGEFLEASGHEITVSPNTKISEALHELLLTEFKSDFSQKQQSDEVLEAKRQKKEALIVSEQEATKDKAVIELEAKIAKDVAQLEAEVKVEKEEVKVEKEEVKVEKQKELVSKSVKEDADTQTIDKSSEIGAVEEEKVQVETKGPVESKIKLKKLGTIQLPDKKQSSRKVASSSHLDTKKKKRKRILGDNKKVTSKRKEAPDQQEVKNKIAETLEQLTSKGKSKSAKIRREKRQESN